MFHLSGIILNEENGSWNILNISVITLITTMIEERSSVQIKKADLKRLWNLVNSERRLLRDVISFLLDFYETENMKYDIEGVKANA